MSHHNEYLVHTYITDLHREAQQTLPGRGRDTSRQKVRRGQEVRRAKSRLPYDGLT